VRLFVSLELPGTVRAALAVWGERAAAGDPALRALPEDSVHLTLVFLGERPDGDVARLGAAVRESAAGMLVPGLSLGEALWLSPRRPHVLTVAVGDADGALARLQAGVAGAVDKAVGFEPEARTFLPHVTVARVRRGARPRQRALPGLPEVDPAVFGGQAVCLMRSRLGRGGARYEALERVPLQG
jgi:RNA 2',3'-cyclic 3'-phosphodiesterase